MKLAEAYEELKKMQFPFPFYEITCEVGKGICDNICIYVSQDDKSTWTNGIYQNSRYAVLHIFCLGQRERENDKYSFTAKTGYKFDFCKMRKMNFVELDKIVAMLKKSFASKKENAK